MDINKMNLTVKCGKCGGQIHFQTCQQEGHALEGWVIGSICLDCGESHNVSCSICKLKDEREDF